MPSLSLLVFAENTQPGAQVDIIFTEEQMS